MGANPIASGTIFRTWAPNAQSVSVVAGARLQERPVLTWRPDPSDALVRLGDGTWAGFRHNVRDGEVYMFSVDGHAGKGWKRDPYARELTLEPAFPESFCVVREPKAYPWHDHDWRTPAFNDLIVYQLHIGTFWAQDENGRDIRAIRGGTFLDCIFKLGYLRELGVNAIQLLPIQEFETRFSLGYNGVDYFSPEGLYVAEASELRWQLKEINAMLASFGQIRS